MRHFLVLSLLLCSCIVSAQEGRSPVVLDKQYPLRSLVESGVAEKTWGTRSLICGDYFAAPRGEVSPDLPGTSIYFESGTNPKKPGYIFGFWGRDRFITLIDETKKVPTATFTIPSDPNTPVEFYWIIRISQIEFEKSRPCMPDPETVPALIAKRPS